VWSVERLPYRDDTILINNQRRTQNVFITGQTKMQDWTTTSEQQGWRNNRTGCGKKADGTAHARRLLVRSCRFFSPAVRFVILESYIFRHPRRQRNMQTGILPIASLRQTVTKTYIGSLDVASTSIANAVCMLTVLTFKLYNCNVRCRRLRGRRP